ncbi:hypothetical protein DMNBHIDG_02167 [Candidatus Methanoperedenaceae archaeon GB37]|nr:hypothetical protein DMNBHIDG_02167 [Candidatus Methanoperedenaceae archaeon GB37]
MNLDVFSVGMCLRLFTLKKNEQTEMKCPECGGRQIERVISKLGIVSTKTGSIRSTFKSCSSGTCGSLEIPGPEK